MSSGLNPAGTLCVGAINTSEILIGNAIKIDNTTEEIYFHDIKVPTTTDGTLSNFDSVITSKAGLNPSGALRVGISTSQIDMGLLKIDNTVVPSQIYVHDVAYPPIDKDLHYYFLAADASGDVNSLPSTIVLINGDGNDEITITNNNIINLVEGGIYEFTIEVIIIG